MGDKLLSTLVYIFSSLIAVAIIALIISKRSATPDVLRAGGQAFSSILNSAFGAGYGNRVGLPFQVPTITIG